MLYEVITACQELIRRDDEHIFLLFLKGVFWMKKTITDYRNDLSTAEKQLEQATHRIERLEQKINVITSYSIHYTKLYDCHKNCFAKERNT